MNKVGNGDASGALGSHWDCVTTQNVCVHTDTHTKRPLTQGYPEDIRVKGYSGISSRRRITAVGENGEGHLVRGSLLGWKLFFQGAEMSLPCWLGTLSVDQGVLPLPILTLGHERLVVSLCQPGRR